MNGRATNRVAAAFISLAAALALAGCTGSTSAGTASAAALAAGGASSPVSSTAPTTPQVTVSSVPDLTTSSTSSSPTSTTTTTTTSTTTKVIPPKPIAPAVAASPKLGTNGISPRTPVIITAARGTIAALAFTNSAGKSIKGSLSADKTTWTLGEPLGYDTTYTVTGRAIGAGGTSTKISGQYVTVSPDDLINASVSPGDGETVGIGAPILISLGTDIDDTAGRANIEKAITVTTVPKTEGAFAWIQHDDGWGLDWRPKSYWKPGTQVTVTANLYGVSYGNNYWGKEDLTSTFIIGRSEITKGDINTHRLKVYENGKLKFDLPTSFGLESDPGRVTRGGTYIVMSKEYLHLMSNPAYHYTNFKAYYAVRISNNGTFIHANDGTDDVQGYQNVTHGCANLSTENAQLFYDQTMYGDPVEITGSSIPMSQSDGDIYDWSISWSDWLSRSAVKNTQS